MQATEQELNLAINTGLIQGNNSLFFPQQNTRSAQSVLYYQGNLNSIELQAAATYEYSKEGQKEQQQTQAIISELFWQGSINNWDFWLGKHRLELGVAYAYRPMDLFSRQQRNPINLQIEEGIAYVAASYFNNQAEVSLFYADARIYQQEHLEQQESEQGLGVRSYYLNNDNEWHSLLYYDRYKGINLGFSWVNTFELNWELHSEILFQQQYKQWQQHSHYLEQIELNNALVALIGLTWTHQSGHNLIVEYWYDQRAWSHNQWQKLFTDTKQSNSTRSSNYSQSFLASSLIQHNLMLHWQLDNMEILQNPLEWAIDLQFSLQDRGLIATNTVSYEITQKLKLSNHIRYFYGRDNSVYAQLPQQTSINLTMEYFF